MRHYAIRSPSATHREVHEAGFEERLYGHLKAAPWWLASAASHGAFFVLLSLLAGEGGVAQARAEGLDVSREAPPVDLEPDVEPDFESPRIVEAQERILPTAIEDVPPDVPVVPDADPDLPPDERFLPGPFEGKGVNTAIGPGGGARGGGGGGNPFGPRTPNLLDAAGRKTRDATEAGLEWLRRHQSPQGNWDGDGFESRCGRNRCGGPGGPLHDPGLTGFALLAFLGAGETHRSETYGAVVRGGLRWLKGVQDAEGCFGSRAGGHFVYDHALGTLAMVEAYGMTQSPLFKASAQNGVNFVTQCRNPYLAWRYGVRPQDNDTSVTGWMVMALKSAALSGLETDPDCIEGARAWMDRVTEPEYGRAGYTARGNGPARPQELMDRFPPDRSESLTAVAVLTRIFCGEPTTSPEVRRGADLCLRSLPLWDEAAGTVDHYYWYYGTLAMFQVGGDHWKRWRAAMEPAILGHQNRDPADCRNGSWDPVDPWGPDGGRVYSTAALTLCLEVYYRYKQVAGAR